jgi:hypothetical protein
MKTLHYIATETHFTAGTLIWLGKILEIIIIINPSSGESTLFSTGTAQSIICKKSSTYLLQCYNEQCKMCKQYTFQGKKGISARQGWEKDKVTGG